MSSSYSSHADPDCADGVDLFPRRESTCSASKGVEVCST